MAWNKWTVQKWTREISKTERKEISQDEIFKLALKAPEGAPDEIASFDTEAEATAKLEEFAGKSCIRDMGRYNLLTAYAIECYNVDEEGDWINGSDYIFGR